MNTLVINRRIESECTCKCGNWLLHWENNANLKAVKCSAHGCNNISKFGKEVYLLGNGYNHCYIIPLCKLHASELLNFTPYQIDIAIKIPGIISNCCFK